MNKKDKRPSFLEELKEVLIYDDKMWNSGQSDVRIKSVTCIIMGLFSAILTVLNIGKGYYFMACTTAFLAVVIILAGVMYKIHDNRRVPHSMVALSLAVILSYYAISGANEGFAILWITCVPLLATLWMGIGMGMIISVYFQVLLIVLFYTGIRNVMKIHYSDIFMIRYPVLYLSILVSSNWMYYQKLLGHKESEDAGRRDAITGIQNRLGYNQYMEEFLKCGAKRPVCALVFDINRLKYVNDHMGHSAGDEMIVAASEMINESFSDKLIFARVGGDEFYMVISGSPQGMDERRRVFYERCAAWKGESAPFLSISCGYAMGEIACTEDLDNLIGAADRDMYCEKSEYYRSNNIDRRRR